MAFEGLVQWTAAVFQQSRRTQAADADLLTAMRRPHPDHQALRFKTLAFHAECHYFAVAAFKLIEFREWVSEFGLCQNLDFSEIDAFNKDDIRDLRNMREHIKDYFKGSGHSQPRWMKQRLNILRMQVAWSAPSSEEG